jgi:hypothetical protein
MPIAIRIDQARRFCNQPIGCFTQSPMGLSRAIKLYDYVGHFSGHLLE